MSIVIIQVGQCGNQLGASLLDQLFEECQGSPLLETFFIAAKQAQLPSASSSEWKKRRGSSHLSPWVARACLIDTEPKAVDFAQQVSRASGRWTYDARCRVVGRRGAGNNWALGYHEHAAALSEDISSAVRCAVETCDRVAGFLVLMSLAGGTGSGVGAFVCELLRDLYPHQTTLCVPVGPYSAGEVIVQSYNAILSLSSLLGSCSGVICVSNSSLHKICHQRLALDKISLLDLNSALCNQLANILLPCNGQPSCRLADICTHLCSNPDYKLLQLYSVPQVAKSHRDFSSYSWTSLTRTLAQMVCSGASSEDCIDWSIGRDDACCKPFCVCIACVLFSRGYGSSSVNKEPLESLPYCRWTPKPLLTCSSEQPRRTSSKSCTMLANSTACTTSLHALSHKAWHMYTSQAYVHQYTSHGCTDADFLQAFSHFEQVIANYQRLSMEQIHKS